MSSQASPRAAARKYNHDYVALAADLLPVWDVFVMLLTPLLANWIYGGFFASQSYAEGPWAGSDLKAMGAAALAPFVLHDRRFGQRAELRRGRQLFGRFAMRWLQFGGVLLALGYATRALDDMPRLWVGLWLAASAIATLSARWLMAAQVSRLEAIGVLSQSIAVVGAGPIADRLIRHLLQAQPGRIELVGVFDDRGSRHADRLFQPAGRVDDLIELGKQRPIDWILVALPASADDRVMEIVHALKTLSVPIGLAPETVGLRLPKQIISYVGDDLPVTLLADRPIRKWDAVVKKAEDLVLGGLITLALLPLLAVVAVLIRLDSPGPILFKQRRHATNNREFSIYKFRTMRWAPESAQAAAGVIQQTQRNDPRITRLGAFLRKTSIDELPQLFNVLQGDMSLVGPRPHAVNMRTEEQLGHEIVDTYAHRHRVKPGITGWSQVNGSRGATDTVEQLRRRVELDLYYVENWSLWLDIKILFMTVAIVFRGTNAY